MFHIPKIENYRIISIGLFNSYCHCSRTKAVFQLTFKSPAGDGSGSPFSAAPANPETNIKGGALGYFGAFTSSKKEIIVTD